MKNINVVIGAGYGDEGKGLATDFFSWKFSSGTSAVVRFNGGAQAGHGVELASGFRHVFHTLGSGTFNGATTILGRHFIVNPALFWLEVNELTENLRTANASQPLPNVYVDPRCIITTPYEMMLNQVIERQRNGERHGSCGVGIGETVERESRGFNLTVQDVLDGELERILTEIEDTYVPERLIELGVEEEYEILDAVTFTRFVQDTYDFVRTNIVMDDYVAIAEMDNIVFEGAQGLCLDENSKDFPHVTRSFTGLKNVVEILADCELVSSVDVTYVTRAYSTRHGAGPFVGEITDRVVTVVDKTNAPNEFQGSMRYAALNSDRVGSEILNDIEQNSNAGIRINPNLLVTHCDQLPKVTDELPEQVVNNIASRTGISNVRTSWGPTKYDIQPGCPITESVL